MGRIIKWLVIMAILGVVSLSAYAYIGPFFGADFRPDVQEVRQSIVIDAQ